MSRLDREQLDSNARLAERTSGHFPREGRENYFDVQEAQKALPALVAEFYLWLAHDPKALFFAWDAERSR